ncbi:MAG: hypothetical protein EBU90_03595 [Proteobacteria bacterium]|nr:hypothetical protein [Pseudomonadota bacterium]NBP13691.1 hypothetical protein [bacterium]
MNLGIYIPSIGDRELLSNCLKEIYRGKKNNLISDASIFYNNSGPIDTPVECGLFNATDLWYFSGKLLVLSTECAIKTLGIVNNIDLYFGYGWNDRNVLNILKVLEMPNVKVICKSKELENDLYRISGKKSIGITDNLSNVIEILKSN